MTSVPISHTPEGLKPEETKHCPACNKALHLSATVCPYCGAIQPGTTVRMAKSRIGAALLAIFLGGFGIHKFYLGRTFWGIIYLLFFWTFIPQIIAFIEGILYLLMSDEKFFEKYG